MQVCVLASGSAANCTVVRTPAGVMLIDAGLGPRATASRMVGTGVSVADVKAICLTHLDRDHFNLNWVKQLVRHGITVHCDRSRVDDLCRLADCSKFAGQIRPFGVGMFSPLPGVSMTAIPLAHDATGSHGFVIECNGSRFGLATDLGHVPGTLIDAFQRLDFLALESNYDHEMQRQSVRPDFLKRRITGGYGHLSNEQSFDAVRTILKRCQKSGDRLPAHVVLLHRSLECNCPHVVRQLFAGDARIAPRLTLAEQFTATGWLSTQPKFVGEQLSFGF